MDTPNTVILPVICWAQLLDPLVGGSDFWQRDRLIILSNPMLQFQLPMASEIRAQWKSGISGSRGRPEATSGQKEPPGEREDVCSTLSENAVTSLTVVRWKSWEKHLFFIEILRILQQLRFASTNIWNSITITASRELIPLRGFYRILYYYSVNNQISFL